MDFKNTGYSWTSKIQDTHRLQKYSWRILMDFKNMGYSWTSKIWDTHGLQKYGILMDFKNKIDFTGYS